MLMPGGRSPATIPTSWSSQGGWPVRYLNGGETGTLPAGAENIQLFIGRETVGNDWWPSTGRFPEKRLRMRRHRDDGAQAAHLKTRCGSKALAERSSPKSSLRNLRATAVMALPPHMPPSRLR